MQLLKTGFTLLLMITLLTGCSADNVSIDSKIETMFKSAYTAECSAKVKSNKTKNEYEYVCKRLDDGTYIVDYGDIVLTVGENSSILSGENGDITAGKTDSELALIPTYFFESYLKGGKILSDDGGYVLACDISGDTPYRATALLELDEKLVPQKMCIEDTDGEDIIEINIKKFLR